MFSYQLRTFESSFQITTAILVGLLIGFAILWVPAPWLFVLLMLIPVTIFSFRYPELGILLIIIILCTIIPEAQVPKINLGRKFYITEIVFIIFTIYVIYKWLLSRNTTFVITPIGILLILFFLWAIGVTFYQLLYGSVEEDTAISEMRIVSYYLTFILAVNLLRNKDDISRLIKGLLFIATIVSGLMIIQFILGPTIKIIPGRVEQLITDGRVHSQVTRIMDTTGEGLITVAFILQTTLLFIRKVKLSHFLSLAQWAILGIGVILTFSRAHWVLTFLSLFLLLFFIESRIRWRIIQWFLVLFFLSPLVILPILAAPDSPPARLVTASIERAFSVANFENYVSGEESTLRWRDFEYVYGIPQIIKNPVTGLGLGAQYRHALYKIDTRDSGLLYYLHNSHLWIAIKTGLVGYFFFISFIFLAVWRGFRLYKKVDDLYFRGAILGFTLALFSAVWVGIIHAVFMSLFWTPLLGLIIGINEAMYRILIQNKTRYSLRSSTYR